MLLKDKVKKRIQLKFLKAVKAKCENPNIKKKFGTLHEIEDLIGISNSAVSTKLRKSGTDSLGEIILFCIIHEINYQKLIQEIIDDIEPELEELSLKCGKI